MTRFGVAKHLAVLEEGGLVVTRGPGRSKLHYLNPVPIRLIHDRWISKYAAPGWERSPVSRPSSSSEDAAAEVAVPPSPPIHRSRCCRPAVVA